MIEEDDIDISFFSFFLYNEMKLTHICKSAANITGVGDWADSFNKAVAMVKNMTLAEKVSDARRRRGFGRQLFNADD